MNVLVFSLRSDYCKSLVSFINEHDTLVNSVKFHDVNKSGVPNGISRVPSMITSAGKILIGGDIKEYLEGFIQTEPMGKDVSRGTFDIDGNDDEDMFDFNQFGTSLAPKMTPDLEERIAMNVQDAFQKFKS
jgi:hypothetical protein